MAISAATRASRIPDVDVQTVLRILLSRHADTLARNTIARMVAESPLDDDVSEYTRPISTVLEGLRARIFDLQNNAMRAVTEAHSRRAAEIVESSSEIAPPPPGPPLDLADALTALFATAAPIAPDATEATTTQDP